MIYDLSESRSANSSYGKCKHCVHHIGKPSVQLPANDGRDIFKDTREVTERADLAVGNLEGAVCDGGTSTKGTGPNSYAFRMPTRFAPLLKEAGYDYLSMANNHANDFGTEGIVSTEKVLDAQMG